MAKPFVHLHLHSEYSLLDGGNRMDRLVSRIKELGMDAVAVTDHGNLFGAMSFYRKAKKAQIKPILGIEAYVAPGDRRDRERTGVKDGGFHLVLLAENVVGWRHLLKLSSDAYINGFYHKPRMDKQTLAQWSDGLIAINGHLGSSMAFWLRKYVTTGEQKYYDEAVSEAKWHAETFGQNEQGESRFFVELQCHSVREQAEINPHLIEIARSLALPIVGDNDSHFLLEDDWDAHDTLCCISMGKVKTEENRLRYPRELFVKSPDEMWSAFGEATEVPDDVVAEALENTAKIAERCEVDLDSEANHAPVVKIVKSEATAKRGRFADRHEVGSTEWYKAFCSQYELLPFDATKDRDLTEGDLKRDCDRALRELCDAGMIWRYGESGVTEEHQARLDRELTILADKHISAYFLIVWDFVNEARRRGIPSSARGSGVGTMVGYVLGLSNACPIDYGLLFERFTDPDRSEYPDIDIDICQDGRQEIIDYVREKYGHVAQIITFGTLKARAAIRDVGRVNDLPLSDVDKLCKLIGDGLGVTINDALEKEPDLRELYEGNPLIRSTIDTAIRLEGMARHAGVHAAGVVVATQPLDNIVPLAVNRQQNKEILVTQWDGPTVESVGLLKMDFLGLRTHSIVERARQLIGESLPAEVVRSTVASSRQAQGLPELDVDPMDLDRLIFDDQQVFDIFRRGETAGVFQFESGGMRNTLMGIKPDRLEDLIAANALFRPGPMELIGDYNDRKHGRAVVPKMHEIVEKFTDETYGIMVYQEQVMQIVHELGDIPLRQAYSLIKAISKKKENVINANRDQFIKGAAEKGVSNERAAELFGLILKFAGYGFNKSHSTGYAILAYQTAYLKTYFPVQYMAALLTYEAVSTDKVVEYIDECKRVRRPNGERGVAVRPPDINLSVVAFTAVFDESEAQDANHGHIRFGLGAVKGVGEKAIEAIIKVRDKDGPFTGLHDFCERVPLGSVNRSTIEALIKCGAFDSIHGIENRAALCAALDGAVSAGQRAAADRDSGQMNFFGSFGESESTATVATATEVALPAVEPWSKKEMLDHEKAVLGLWVSSHPLDDHEPTINRFATVSLADALSLVANVEVTVGGILSRVRPTFVKKGRSAGQKMAMITISDGRHEMDGVIFSDGYAVAAPVLQQDRIVLLRGKIDRRREAPNLIVNEVIPVERASQRLTRSVRIRLRQDRATARDIGAPGYNGELNKLKELLRQSSINGSDASAEVIFELYDGGKVVLVKMNGLRVQVDDQLPVRINTVLREDACELLGGPKLDLVKNPSLRHADGQDEQPKLGPSQSHEGSCDSIDRY